MDEIIKIGINNLKQSCKLKEGDTYNYGSIQLNPLFRFKVQRYNLEEIGNLSVMSINIGIIRMVTFIITPYLIDLPMLSADFMSILSKRKTYLELYDLTENKNTESYQNILKKLQIVLDECKELKDFDHQIG